MSKIGGQRNFGYGKMLRWAGQQALKEKLGDGRYATQKAHSERWALELMREDRQIRVSPAAIVGQRTNVRETAPGVPGRWAYPQGVFACQSRHRCYP